MLAGADAAVGRGGEGLPEPFVASTAMEPITGLVAECRRELDRVLMERTAGRRGMTVERDEAVRRELEGRKLLMDRQGEAEIESGEAGQGLCLTGGRPP